MTVPKNGYFTSMLEVRGKSCLELQQKRDLEKKEKKKKSNHQTKVDKTFTKMYTCTASINKQA